LLELIQVNALTKKHATTFRVVAFCFVAFLFWSPVCRPTCSASL
jgi:hypothetical protein